MASGFQVVVDCTDPQRLAGFWKDALGYVVQPPPEGFATWEDWLRGMGIPPDQWNSAFALVDPDGQRPRLFFQRVPEPKVVKNRLHLDLNVGGGRGVAESERRQRVDAEAERLVGLGATRERVFQERGEYWVAMHDPEGNEFDLQ